MSRIHRVAIIGAGNITSLRHIPALRGSGRTEIVGVIDRHEDRARRVADRFRLPHCGTDMGAAWMKDVEAVSIGVPPAAHAAVASELLRAGKHVLLEKPMALTVEEAEGLVRLAREQNRILALVHNFQFARSAMKLKQLIRDGKLGEVRGILCFQLSTTERRLPVWAEELPLGLFYDEAPHLLYLLRAFGGEVAVRSVSATPSLIGRATPAVITAQLSAGNVPAVLYNNFEAPVSEWHFAVMGTKQMGVIDVFRDVLVRLPNDNQHLAMDVMRTSYAGIRTHLAGVFTSGLAMLRGKLLYGNDEVVRRFLDAIETGRSPGDTSAEDGLAVLKLQHEIVRRANA